MDDTKTLYRNDASDTSIEAAQSIDPSRLEAVVLSVIKTFKNGCISDEVREYCKEKYNIDSYSSVTARYASLARKRLISFSGETRPGKSGRGQRVMFAVMEKNDG
jgi:hypothetical protein|tara:strand:+ start:155 stop:469 length:315 start_codon:yes stop_codon:yes gene_type:complete